MDLPKLNYRLHLQRADKFADGGGGFITTWVDLGVHWSAVTFRTGRTGSGETGPMARQPVTIVLRSLPFDHDLRPKPGMALVYGSRRFVIDAVSDGRPTPLYITCTADQEVTL